MTTKTLRSRRWGVSASLLALCLVVAGCGGAQAPAQKSSADSVTGPFVGKVSNFAGDPQAVPSVAVVAPEVRDGTREVQAYLCDGLGLAEFFTGTAVGNDLALTSKSGARLEGRLSPEAAAGTVTLAGGAGSFSFEAIPTTGVAGYYDVMISPDGRLRGTSAFGARVAGQVAGEQISGTITSPEGQPRAFAFTAPNAPTAGPGDYRWNVTNDGQLDGAKWKAQATSEGGSEGFTSRDITI